MGSNGENNWGDSFCVQCVYKYKISRDLGSPLRGNATDAPNKRHKLCGLGQSSPLDVVGEAGLFHHPGMETLVRLIAGEELTPLEGHWSAHIMNSMKFVIPLHSL